MLACVDAALAVVCSSRTFHLSALAVVAESSSLCAILLLRCREAARIIAIPKLNQVAIVLVLSARVATCRDTDVTCGRL